ncbi:MAG: hypothetical protein WCL53_06000 [Chloroflexota bacterium]
MYVIRTEMTVPTTRAVEFQREDDARLEFFQAQPGFHGELLLNSLGYPVMQYSPMYFHETRYVLLTSWESTEAASACFGGGLWGEFCDLYPSEALYEPERTTAFHVISTESRYANALFAWTFEVTQGERRTSRMAIEGLASLYREQFGLTVHAQVLQQADAPESYLVVLALVGQTDGFPPGVEVDSIRAFFAPWLADDAAVEELAPEGFQIVQHVGEGVAPPARV